MAFQKVWTTLPAVLTAQVRQVLEETSPPAQVHGEHLEIPCSRKTLYEWRDPEDRRAVASKSQARQEPHARSAPGACTGGDRLGLGAVPPSMYFPRGFAIHGYPSVPA